MPYIYKKIYIYCLECSEASTFKILLDFTDSTVTAEAAFNKLEFLFLI